MRRILITGAESYIGTTFEKYIKSNYPNKYYSNTIDMIDGGWKDMSFEGYDVVFHVAGIAHSDIGKASNEIREKYYAVNRDLTIETAEKAKKAGVKQFIFMSSIIVFGSKNECITIDTVPNPDNFYGDSKLQADIGIQKLQDEDFNVVSIRPPMIYGKGSKGNYPKLSSMVKKIPFFPDYDNKRSMLYVENLCEFICWVIENDEKGYFYPQNDEYVKTSELVKNIAKVNGKKIYMFRWLNPFISKLKRIRLINKIFGDMYYDKNMSLLCENYCVSDFDNSIERTEEK